jgi:peptidoglycan hydrolase-like protein with peptidoglycan-binding domain
MAEPTLKKGSKGQAVEDLQEALKALGFSPGTVDGIFGTATEQAVEEFQASVGIDADGVVGPITWTNIDEADQSEPVLRKGSTGLPVRRLQHRMSAVGFDTGGVDGRFGAKTEQAVRQLQEQAGIDVDGIVGPDTWAVVDALEDEGAAA